VEARRRIRHEVLADLVEDLILIWRLAVVLAEQRVQDCVMHAVPGAVVMAAAALALMVPPTTVPTPGNSFNRPPPKVRPVSAAAVPPSVPATSVIRKALDRDRP
jgi:hypothetical protein